MKRNIKLVFILVLLIFAFTLSACSSIGIPDDLDDVVATPFPTATAKPQETSAPQIDFEEREDFGIVKLESTEDKLFAYYGITFPESEDFQANFYCEKGEYFFGDIPLGVTCDFESLPENGSVNIFATVSAFDTLGNKLSKGITSNMTTQKRLDEFESDKYAHGLAISLPGTYYVEYKVDVKNGSDVKTYILSRKFTVDKVDVSLSTVSDFFFVNKNGADEKQSAQILAVSGSGWDITKAVFADIKSTCGLTLEVEKFTAEVSKENEYPLEIVAKKNDEIVSNSLVKSASFNLDMEYGNRYILPAKDEVEVSALYKKLESIGVDYFMEEMDFAKWDEYMAVLEIYNGLSENGAIMFDLYPAYLWKYDKSFGYKALDNMNWAHDWMMKFAFDCGRVEIANELSSLLADYEAGKAEIADIANYLADLESENAYVDNCLVLKNGSHYSDLEFAVKFAFGGKFSNGENKFVDLQIENGIATFANSNAPVNDYIFAKKRDFDIFCNFSGVLNAIANGDEVGACENGSAFASEYASYKTNGGNNKYAEYLYGEICEYLSFEYDIKYDEHIVTATAKFKQSGNLTKELIYDVSVLSECLKDSNELHPQLATAKTHGEYAVSQAKCQRLILQYNENNK